MPLAIGVICANGHVFEIYSTYPGEAPGRRELDTVSEDHKAACHEQECTYQGWLDVTETYWKDIDAP